MNVQMAEPQSPHPSEPDQPGNSFDESASSAQPGLFAEFAAYVMTHKKWWIVPILLALLFAAALAFIGSSPLAPFIYPM